MNAGHHDSQAHDASYSEHTASDVPWTVLDTDRGSLLSCFLFPVVDPEEGVCGVMTPAFCAGECIIY